MTCIGCPEPDCECGALEKDAEEFRRMRLRITKLEAALNFALELWSECTTDPEDEGRITRLRAVLEAQR